MQHFGWVMAISRPVCTNVSCKPARARQYHETIKAWIVNLCRHISGDVSRNVCSIEILESSSNSSKKMLWSTFHYSSPFENSFLNKFELLAHDGSWNLKKYRPLPFVQWHDSRRKLEALKKKKAAAGKKAAPSDAVKAAAAEVGTAHDVTGMTGIRFGNSSPKCWMI